MWVLFIFIIVDTEILTDQLGQGLLLGRGRTGRPHARRVTVSPMCHDLHSLYLATHLGGHADALRLRHLVLVAQVAQAASVRTRLGNKTYFKYFLSTYSTIVSCFTVSIRLSASRHFYLIQTFIKFNLYKYYKCNFRYTSSDLF